MAVVTKGPVATAGSTPMRANMRGMDEAIRAARTIAVAVAVALTLWLSRSPQTPLDPSRVVVYPLDAPGGPG